MKLRELFDKLTPGMLDSEVELRIVFNAGTPDEFANAAPVHSVLFSDEGEVTILGIDRDTARR